MYVKEGSAAKNVYDTMEWQCARVCVSGMLLCNRLSLRLTNTGEFIAREYCGECGGKKWYYPV